MAEHRLKTWPQYFEKQYRGEKPFELRKNDRDYQEGDTLILEEYNPETCSYTGRKFRVRVGYVVHGPAFGLAEGHCIMATTYSGSER